MSAITIPTNLLDQAKVQDNSSDGIDRLQVQFPNGYGISVIRGQHTYGGPQGLFEIAVLDSEGDLRYDTPITGDVVGWLTEDEVVDYARRIAALDTATLPALD